MITPEFVMEKLAWLRPVSSAVQGGRVALPDAKPEVRPPMSLDQLRGWNITRKRPATRDIADLNDAASMGRISQTKQEAPKLYADPMDRARLGVFK